jgi:hypothetical protein
MSPPREGTVRNEGSGRQTTAARLYERPLIAIFRPKIGISHAMLRKFLGCIRNSLSISTAYDIHLALFLAIHVASLAKRTHLYF